MRRVSALLLVAGIMPAHAADYRVFAIDAPPAPGIYRLRPSLQASNAWAVEQFQNISIFDADGKSLCYERVLNNALVAQVFRRHELDGNWLDEAARATLPRVQGFAADAVFDFAPAGLAAHEFPSRLEFDWHADAAIGNAQLQFLGITDEGKELESATSELLSNEAPTSVKSHDHKILNLGNLKDRWQLRFTRLPAGFAVEHATLTTSTPRPWINEPVDWPNWIVFQGNGHVPYAIQYSQDGSGCYGINHNPFLLDAPLPTQQADWPPETNMGAEIRNAGRLGEPSRARVSAQTGVQHPSPWDVWLVWSAIAGVVFVIAAAGIWLARTNQRRPAE